MTPLDHLPEVESGSAKQWLDTNLAWWEDESRLAGRARAERAAELAQGCRSGPLSRPSLGIPVKPTTVTHARMTNSTVSFDVGRLGAPCW